jgi:hypothetical protein
MSGISLTAAVEMTSRFRTERENILIPELRGQDLLPVCETYDRAEIERLLAQAGCAGLRIYYGMYADKTVHAVLVGVTADDADILPATGALAAGTDEGEIVNDGWRCPPTCPPASDLNG